MRTDTMRICVKRNQQKNEESMDSFLSELPNAYFRGDIFHFSNAVIWIFKLLSRFFHQRKDKSELFGMMTKSFAFTSFCFLP